MAITSSNIAILASERLNDDDDGGGYMTGTPVQDNVENNLFPDISSLDRARGSLHFRKIYPAVLSADADVYYGAHVIIDAAPADPEVGALLVAGTNQAETRSQRIDTLATASFYGIKQIKGNLAVNAQVLEVGGLTTRLIPSTKAGTAESGVASRAMTGSRTAYIAGDSAPLILSSDSRASNTWPAMPGSLVGATVTDTVPHDIINLDIDGSPFATIDSPNAIQQFFADRGVAFNFNTGGALTAATAVAGTYTRCLSQSLPVVSERLTYTSAMSPVVVMTLVSYSEIGSEIVEWTDVNGVARSLINHGLASFSRGTGFGSPTGSINRSSKALTLLLDPAPKVGTDIVVSYVKAGYVQSIASPGSFADGSAAVAEAPSYGFAKAFFRANGVDYFCDGSAIYRWIAPTISMNARAGAVVGSYNKATKVLAVPELPAGAVAISSWVGIQVSALFPVDEVTGWTIPPNMDPALITISGNLSSDGSAWSASSDAFGAFSTALVSGTYDTATGALDLSFTQAVSSTIAYSGTRFSYTPVGAGVTGVNPGAYATNGEVPVFRVGDVVVVHNTRETAPATVTTSSTIATRANIDEARLIGADGQEIFTGYVVNKSTGNVTFTSVAGYSQPVTVRHRQEDMATVVAATSAGRLTLSKPLKHAYAATDTFVSSALELGDLQARARPGFQQATWLGHWLDAVEGATILADFNEVAYPIVCTNRGAIKERWALIFTSSTAFRIIGEEVGEIGTGSTNVVCSPMNPVTLSPFWTIDPLAWGGGWAVGNVYRFNTDGANRPAWLIRPINPSEPFAGPDKITVAVRGDINA